MLFVGAMEGDLVQPSEDCMHALYNLQPRNRRGSGYHPFTQKQMDLLKRYDIPWKDCLLTRPNGRYTLELFHRNGIPLVAPAVYAARGNAQHKYWLEQARFIVEEVGMDGVYTDQFSTVFGERFEEEEVFTHFLRFTHDRWDGVTVDIDRKTGQISRKYTDGALAGIGARADLIDYVLSRGKVMVANMHAAVKEIQSRPIFRFVEAQLGLDPLAVRHGQEPPLRPLACKGQLDSPIAIGYPGGPQHTYAKAVMKTVVAYLRHGLLYYTYGTDMPETGPGSGEFGPINHMFPLTPVGLHKGWVEGRERIVTCVSGTYSWPHKKRPGTHLFDIHGRALPHRFALTRSGRGWDVNIGLEDWEQIAILEEQEKHR